MFYLLVKEGLVAPSNIETLFNQQAAVISRLVQHLEATVARLRRTKWVSRQVPEHKWIMIGCQMLSHTSQVMTMCFANVAN